MAKDNLTPGEAAALNVHPCHPGASITEYIDHKGWSQQQAANATGLSVETVNDLCNEIERVTPDIALRLQRAFGRPAKFWLKLQELYDEAQQEEHDEVQEENGQ